MHVVRFGLIALTAVTLFTPPLEAAKKAPPPQRPYVSESALLEGLAPGAVFPFLDSTPFHIRLAHVAVTDDTANCSAGAAPPDNLQVLVGVAGGTLVPILDADTNTGISNAPGQCVFHATVIAGRNGIPTEVTDIVVVNAGEDAATGAQTVTASAELLGLSAADHVLTESALLAGLAPGAVYPYVDTTPYSINVGHVAVTDDTADCTGGAAPPASIQVLVGEAGGTLVPLLGAGANTGISTVDGQCVFHATFQAGEDGVPARVTDIVVVNGGATDLSGVNTVTATAVLARGNRRGDAPGHDH